MLKDELKSIVQHYQSQYDLGEKVQITDFNTLLNEWFRQELQETLLKFSSSLESNSFTLELDEIDFFVDENSQIQYELKLLLISRMANIKGMYLSPWFSPTSAANKCCWEVFQCLFPQDTLFEYITTLCPEVMTIITVEVEYDEYRELRVVFNELPLTRENTQNLLKPNQITVIDHYVIPVDQFTGHEVRNQKLRILFLTELERTMRQERYKKLRDILMLDSEFRELYSIVVKLEESQTLREEIIRFRKVLIAASAKNTEDPAKLEAVDKALGEFRRYIARFENPDYIVKTVEINISKTHTLADCIQSLVNNDDQCVIEATDWLNAALNNAKNQDLLNQSPRLSEDDKLKLNTEIWEFWNNSTFAWQFQIGDLPPDALIKLCPEFEVTTIDQVITFFANMSSLESYQILLTNLKFRELIKKHFDLFLVNLLPKQIETFFHASLQSLAICAECIPQFSFEADVKLLTSELAATIYRIFINNLPALIKNADDFHFAFSFLPTTMRNDYFAKEIDVPLLSVKDVRRVFKYLYQSQRQQLFSRKKSHINNLIITATDFVTIFDVINSNEEDSFVDEWVDRLPNMVHSPSDFVKLFKIVQENGHDKLRSFYKSVKGRLIELTQTAEDFIDIYLLLNTYKPEYKTYTFPNDFNYRIKYWNLIEPNFSRIIKTGKDFGHVHKNLLSDKEKDTFYNLFQPHFLELIQTVADFEAIAIPVKDEDWEVFWNSVKTKVLARVHTSKDMVIVLAFLSPEEILALDENVVDLIRTFMKNPKDFRTIIDNLEEDQLDALFKLTKLPVPLLMANLSVLNEMIEANPSSHAFINFIEPYLPYLVRKPEDFLNLPTSIEFENLTGIFPFLFNTAEGVALVTNRYDHYNIFSCLGPGALSYILSTTQDVVNLLKNLDQTDMIVACEMLCKEVPHLINSVENFYFIMSGLEGHQLHLAFFGLLKLLPAPQLGEVCHVLENELSDVLKDPKHMLEHHYNQNFRKFLLSLDDEQRAVFSIITNIDISENIQAAPSNIMSLIGSMIIDGLSINFGVIEVNELSNDYHPQPSNVQQINTIEELSLALESRSTFNEDLIKFIQTPEILIQIAHLTLSYGYAQVVRSLDNNFIIPFCIGTASLLPYAIKTPMDFVMLINGFSLEIQQSLCNLMKPNLPFMIKSPKDLNLIAKNLNPILIKIICEELLKGTLYFIRTLNDLVVLLKGLTLQKIDIVCLSLQKQLRYLITSGNDRLDLIDALPQARSIISNVLAKHLTVTDKASINTFSVEHLIRVTTDVYQLINGLKLDEATNACQPFFEKIIMAYEYPRELIKEIISATQHINTTNLAGDPLTPTPLINSYISFFIDTCNTCLTKIRSTTSLFLPLGANELHTIINKLNSKKTCPLEKFLSLNTFAKEENARFKYIMSHVPQGMKRQRERCEFTM